MSTNAITRPAEKQLTIRDRLNQPAFREELSRVLPKHLTAERMTRTALTAITRTPKLAECDQASFFLAILNLAQWGLEPDGRRAHLIPFENRKRGCTECQLIIDYKGIVELCYRSGTVSSIHADVVREGDLFDYSCGKILRHTPWFLRSNDTRPSKAGNVFAAYCAVALKDGAAKTEVMSFDDVEAIRKRSRAGSNGPWVTDWCEMAKKTVFRRASKWLPWSAEIREALENDDDDVLDAPTSAAVGGANVRTLDSLAATIDAGLQSTDAEPQEEQIRDVSLEEVTRAFDGCGDTDAVSELLDQFRSSETAEPAIVRHAEKCAKVAVDRLNK